jgi:hypothetical protein
MLSAKNFYSGSNVYQLFKNLDFSSQKISELLKTFGKEKTLRNFFASYIKQCMTKKLTNHRFNCIAAPSLHFIYKLKIF